MGQSIQDWTKYLLWKTAFKKFTYTTLKYFVSYHPSLNCFNKIIRDKLHLLYMNDEVKKVFSPKPMISFRSARELSSYLVRAKQYRINSTVRSFKSTKKRWEVCENINVTDSFTFSVTQKIYKINHKLNCDDKCLIYPLTCKQWLKKYAGKLQTLFAKDGTTIKTAPESS